MQILNMNDFVSLHLTAEEAEYLDHHAFDLTLQFPGKFYYNPLVLEDDWEEGKIMFRTASCGKPGALFHAFVELYSKEIWDQGFTLPGPKH